MAKSAGAGTAGVAQGIARQVDSRKACAGQGVQHGLCIPALPAACVQDIGGGERNGQRRDLRAQRRIPTAREKTGARLAHFGAVAGVGRTAPVLPQQMDIAAARSAVKAVPFGAARALVVKGQRFPADRAAE